MPLGDCALVRLLLFTGVNRDLGIPDVAFVFADSALITVVSMVLMVPLLALMAQLCPKHLEGTVFSFYTALYNLGGIISAQFSGALQSAFGIDAHNFDNVVWLRVVSGVASHRRVSKGRVAVLELLTNECQLLVQSCKHPHISM